MKTSKLFCAMLVFALFIPFTASFASTAVSAQEARVGFVKKITDSQDAGFFAKVSSSKVAKKAMRAAKRFGADKVDFQTEPTKWLWYGVFAIIIGIGLQIFGWGFLSIWAIAYLGSLLVFLGCLSILYWFLKKEGIV
jgi:hypothetical protein